MGGAERVMVALANDVDRNLYAPTFLVFHKIGVLEQSLKTDITVHDLGNPHRLMALPLLILKLREINADIVFSSLTPVNFMVLLARPFIRAKVLVRETTLPSYFLTRGWIKEAVARTGYATLYPIASRIICPAKRIAQDLKSIFGMEDRNFAVLPNPVDTAAFSTKIEPHTGIRFVFTGRLVREKGLDLLIPALKKFNPAFDWSLDLYGDGPEKDGLQKLIEESGLQNKITLKGYTDKPIKAYAGADCLLLPSRWEGMPNAALESLACGLPVIAMDSAGGIEEVAAQAPIGAVITAKTMDGFISAMTAARARTEEHSLLPPAYHHENVMAQLHAILASLFPSE